MNALIETLNHWAENLFVAASRQSAANIETLNHWGENFLNFAWPMLWQSSLLIAIVFALDYVLARRIRAAVRHALWIVVLVKLLLPPALALPTGAAWWLWRPKPAPITHVVNNYTVSFDQSPTPMPDTFVPPSVPIVPPPPKLSGAGWTMLASGVISAGLLLWLLFRWRRVATKVRRATISNAFTPTLDGWSSRWSVRFSVSGRIRLKLIDDNQSPAVYGLFRPVILLPRALAEKLSARQLRAVLLHEAIHLRRGDVWVNCAQTLLQIAYWWHPLLWFANARIRRVREEAVDDAVMLALRKDADTYAPTLLEVARFAFRRPLASLGLIGILESRSALRQRVERLIDFRPPRKAGLTFLSLFTIFAFSAVALPMGPAPVSENDSTLSKAGDAMTNSQAPADDSVPANTPHNLEMRTFKVNPNTFYVNFQNKLHFSPLGPFNLHTTRDELDGLFYATTPNLAQDGSALAKQYFSRLGLNLAPPKTVFYNDRLGVLFVYATPSDLDIIERAIQVLNAPTNPQNNQVPSTALDQAGVTQMVQQAKQAYGNGLSEQTESALNQALAEEHKEAHLDSLWQAKANPPQTPYQPGQKSNWAQVLGSIHLDQFGPFQHATLSVVVDKLSMKASFIPILTTSKLLNGSQTLIDLPKMTNVAVPDVLDAIVKGANQPIQYSIMGDNIVFLPVPPPANLDDEFFDPVSGTKVFVTPSSAPVDGTNDLEMRTFPVDYNEFITNVCKLTGQTKVFDGFQEILANHGIDLSPPKYIILDRLNGLCAYATANDLDAIGKIVTELCPSPMIHIQARFIEVPKSFLADTVHNYIPAGVTDGAGILTNPDFQVFWHEALMQKGTEEVAMPEGTAISGRQMHMQAVTEPGVPDYTADYYVLAQPPPQNGSTGTGPVLVDVVPTVLADGYTVGLKVTTCVTKVFSYADPTPRVINFLDAKNHQLITVAIQNNQASAQKAVWDDQTLVLFPTPAPIIFLGDESDKKSRERGAEGIHKLEKKESEKVLIAFVTADLIDANGNRIHSDDQMSFAQTGVPPQSP